MPRTHHRDLVTRRFGRLRVEAETEERAFNQSILWRCRCDCGATCLVMTSNLTSGNTLSCGCWQREISRLVNQKPKPHQ